MFDSVFGEKKKKLEDGFETKKSSLGENFGIDILRKRKRD